MRALTRLAAIAVAGAALYYAGLVNAIVIEHPAKVGAVFVVIAIAAALGLIVAALRGTGRGDAALPAPPPRSSVVAMRAVWAFISIMALVSLAWIYGAPRARSFDWTPYHNDAIALNDCAARLLLAGRDPYTSLELFDCYGRLGIGPDRTTPLRRGAFADVAMYPSDEELDRAWARDLVTRRNDEFVWRPSYPALSFVLIAPWVRMGWDANALYLLCLFAAMALVLVRAPVTLRPWVLTALLGSTVLVAFTVGGTADLLYALPLVAAWLWRERGWSGVAFGIACATKQLAWLFAPFYLLQIVATQGWRAGARRAALAAAIFTIANAPFVAADPGAWLAGILTPVAEPMFPRGAGLVFLSTNGVIPLLPGWAYVALQLAAEAVALGVAWRARRSSPELGAALALAPFFFAYRSLFSYFFLIPLFALAAVARMPLGELRPAQARAAGALTLLAADPRARSGEA